MFTAIICSLTLLAVVYAYYSLSRAISSLVPTLSSINLRLSLSSYISIRNLLIEAAKREDYEHMPDLINAYNNAVNELRSFGVIINETAQQIIKSHV